MKQRLKDKINFKTIFPFLGLLAVIIFFQIVTDGKVFASRNLSAILNSSFLILIATIAFSFIMTIGNLDLSMGTVMAVSCTCAALGASISPILAIPCAIIPGFLFGLFNGFVQVHLKMGSLIATMATQSIFSGILIMVLDGGTITAPMKMLRWNTMELKIVVMIVMILVGGYFYNFSAYGKQCKAIGSCEEAARLSGIHVRKVKYMTCIIMGMVAGGLGFFSLIRTGSASAATGSELMINVWCAALLGGLPLSGGFSAKYRSAIVGSFTMAFLANGMTLMGLNMYDQQMIRGVVFLVAIAISFDRKNLAVIK